MIETLMNQVTDETFKQLEEKLARYTKLHDEALIMAFTEIKKQDSWTKQRRIKQDLNRFNMYELPGHANRYRRNS